MVASLGSSKGRRENGCFIAEGTKCVFDTLDHFSCRYLIATAQWVEENASNISNYYPIIAKRSEIAQMSQLSTPSNVIAVYDIPDIQLDESIISSELSIALDRVQDPGNLGTIIRIADWYGIRNIICSHDTVDLYNPKVIQATMGAISRVGVRYCDLALFLKSHQNLPIYGTFLDGKNIYDSELSNSGIIVMGNEGQGISKEIENLVSSKLLIPSYPQNQPTSESLNVSMATAITVAEFRRRSF